MTIEADAATVADTDELAPTACASEDECTYQPFCWLLDRCVRLTATGPVQKSRNLRAREE